MPIELKAEDNGEGGYIVKDKLGRNLFDISADEGTGTIYDKKNNLALKILVG